MMTTQKRTPCLEKVTILSQEEQLLVDTFIQENNFNVTAKYLIALPQHSQELQLQYFNHILSLADKTTIDTVYYYLVLRREWYGIELHNYCYPYFMRKITFCKNIDEIKVAYGQLLYLLKEGN